MSDNLVYVGSKPVMNYVLAVVTQFKAGNAEVVLKARGKAISRAVDAAEIVRHKFVQGAQVKGITIAPERLANEAGEETNVSSIEIRLGHHNGGPPASPA